MDHGTNYPVIAKVYKNAYIRVFAGVGSWYIVQIEGDYVGAVNKSYIKAIYPNTGNTGSTGSTGGSGAGTGGSSTNTGGTTGGGTTTSNTSDLTSDELETFNLINQQRTQNGLAALKIDSEVQRVARIKAVSGRLLPTATVKSPADMERYTLQMKGSLR